jgi:hypothetical protein
MARGKSVIPVLVLLFLASSDLGCREMIGPSGGASERAQGRRYPARSFKSKIPFEVFVIPREGDDPVYVGNTRAGETLEIPACHVWFVRQWWDHDGIFAKGPGFAKVVDEVIAQDIRALAVYMPRTCGN